MPIKLDQEVAWYLAQAQPSPIHLRVSAIERRTLLLLSEWDWTSPDAFRDREREALYDLDRKNMIEHVIYPPNDWGWRITMRGQEVLACKIEVCDGQ